MLKRMNLFSRMSFAGSESFFSKLDTRLGELHEQLETLEARKRRQEELRASFRTKFLVSASSIYVAVLAYAAYVVRQPYDAYPSGLARAVRVAPALVVPIVATAIYRFVDAVFGAMMRHTDKRIGKVNERSEKIVQGLKDDMKFDRTEKLLRKYDREWMSGSHGVGKGPQENLSGSDVGSDRSEEIPVGYNQGATTTPVIATARLQQKEKPPMSLSKKLMMSTVGGASLKLSGALAQLWTLTADTVIGDDPVLLRSLKNAEVHAQTLTEENARLREKLERYENEYGMMYDVNGMGTDSDGQEEADLQHPEDHRSGEDEVADVARVEEGSDTEEDHQRGESSSDEEVVEMVVMDPRDHQGGSDLLAESSEPEEEEGLEEDAKEDEAEPEPELAPAPRRSRRTRRG